MNQRLVHDCALATAHALLKIVEPSLREADRLDALSEFYMACKAGIEAYCIQNERMLARLNPTRN
jgi:hypothetical protein